MNNIANNAVNAIAATLVLVYDFNDSNDEVFAFANASDAVAFEAAIAESYTDTHYAVCADNASMVLKDDALEYFAANYTLAANSIASFDDTLEEEALFDWMHEQRAAGCVVEADNFDDAFDAHLDAMLDEAFARNV